MRQIYAFTPPGPKPGENYVPFLQAFIVDDDNAEIRVRNSEGVEVSIVITRAEAKRLGSDLRWRA